MKKSLNIFMAFGTIAILVMVFLPQLKPLLEAGLAAYTEQDSAQTFTFFTEATEKGDAKAQYNLGKMGVK